MENLYHFLPGFLVAILFLLTTIWSEIKSKKLKKKLNIHIKKLNEEIDAYKKACIKRKYMDIAQETKETKETLELLEATIESASIPIEKLN